jgi:hypothetical protein
MLRSNGIVRYLVAGGFVLVLSGCALAQRSTGPSDDAVNFGPVMRAYLGYLSNEQEVVDDRISRKEITATYYHRNSNRIRALRQMAIKLVRQSGNDYVPELEAVATDELRTLFERPPSPASFHPNEILADKFRFLGAVHSGEVFYLFARLDPYEQAELMQRHNAEMLKTGSSEDASGGVPKGQRVGQAATRPRRLPK